MELELVDVPEDLCHGCHYYQAYNGPCPTDAEKCLPCSPKKIWVIKKEEPLTDKTFMMNKNITSFENKGEYLNLIETVKQMPSGSLGRKYDEGKPMYNLLPADALEEVVKVLTAGAIKYNEPIDQENWRYVDNPDARYFAASQRHQWAHKRGELMDNGTPEKPGTKCYHLACAITSLMFMLQLEIEKAKGKE